MTIVNILSSRFGLFRHLVFACLFFCATTGAAQNSVGIGTTTPDPSALLEISSSTKGVLVPRMTQTQRKSIVSPKNGLLVYDTSTTSFWFYQKDKWQELGYGTNPSDSSFLFGQQSGSIASYNGDPTGSLIIASDSSGFFYDDGGPSGAYSNNAEYFFAIVTPGNVIGYKLQVISNNLENPYDSLFIYTAGDYPVTDTLLGNETASYTLPNSPIVIKFKSNFVNPAPGFVIRWDAILTPQATPSSQPIVAGWQFDPQKVAMHGGFNLNNNWQPDSSGLFSLNYGYANKAKGNYSVALGGYTTARELYSTALGYGTTASGIASTAMGYLDTASGAYSTALGFGSAAKGDGSFAWGHYSLASEANSFAAGGQAQASGFGSTAIGREAKASGSNSVVIGTLGEATATYSSVFGGVQNFATAPYATAIGGVGSTANGDYSVAIGNRISTNGKLGSVAIGDLNFSSGLSNDADNQMLMRFMGGYKLYLNDASLIMTITNLGNMGIGTDAPDEKLHVNGNIKCVALTQTSDSRLKKNILRLENSLDKLIQLNGYSYQWKNEQLGRGFQTGLIAQEVQNIFPDLVKRDKDGALSVNYIGLIPVMIESIKSQQQQIDELKQMIKNLMNK